MPPPKEKTREQKEAELIPKMQEAVNYGLRVLESAFEHLDIKAGNSDSEDEEVTDRVEAILEPKVSYRMTVFTSERHVMIHLYSDVLLRVSCLSRIFTWTDHFHI